MGKANHPINLAEKIILCHPIDLIARVIRDIMTTEVLSFLPSIRYAVRYDYGIAFFVANFTKTL